MQAMRAVPAFWFTLAFNVAALWFAVLLVALAHFEPGMPLPLAALALTGAVGLVALIRPQTRGFGVGCLSGAAASGVVFLALLVVFFITYFVLGGHELS